MFLFAAAHAGPPDQADLDACATAQVENSFEAWDAYLSDHPDGICTRGPAAADVRDCLAARDAKGAEVWSAYAALYPRGFCITEAKAVLHASTDDAGALPAVRPPARRRVGGAETQVAATTAHGALDVTMVEASFEPFLDSLRGCGEGVATVHAAVVASGEVVKLEVDGVDEAVASCVATALTGRLAFPMADGPTRLVHRLSLEPVE